MKIGEGVNFAVVGATALDSSFFEAQGVYNPYTNTSLNVQLQEFKKLFASICDTDSGNRAKFINLPHQKLNLIDHLYHVF